MNILLINPIDRITSGGAIRFPLGLAYISDALSKNGHKVEILDLAVRDWNLQSLEDEIRKYSHIKAIGLTGLITEYNNIREISALLKKHFPEKPIILGGALATSMPAKLMKNSSVDIIVAGEGEVTAKELFEKLEKGEDISDVRGIFFRKNKEIIYTGARQPLPDLDMFGYPSRLGFKIEEYFTNSPLSMFGSKRTLNMITSRGCPYGCVYCDKSLWGSIYRARGPKDILGEIKYLYESFNIDSIIFHDDTFNLKKERVFELCDLLISSKFRINWLANCRANLITLEMAKKMRLAGCRIIAYGIESGNQNILDSMKKNIQLNEAREAITNTWQAGIIPFAYLMIGWFNETREQVLDTINFCINNRIKGDFSFFTPLPNTSSFIQIQSMGNHMLDVERILANWGRWHKHIMINVSAMNDEELISLKEYAERKIFWSCLMQNALLYIKAMGIFCFTREMIRRIIYFNRNGFTLRVERL